MKDRDNLKNLQREFLLAEKKEREELTTKFVDESYVWEGGF